MFGLRVHYLDPQWLTDLNLFWLLVFPTKKDQSQKGEAFFGKETEGLSYS